MNFAECLRHRDFITGNYPQLPSLPWRNALHGQLEVRLVISLLGIPAGMRVLQVGCGSGIALTHISRLCNPKVLMGIDIDATFLGESADRLHEKRVGAHLIQADVRDMPFPDSSFDLVIDFGVCYHIEHPDDALAEIGRVLGASGLFAYETPLAQVLAHPRADRQRLPWEEESSLTPHRSLGLWASRRKANSGGY